MNHIIVISFAFLLPLIYYEFPIFFSASVFLYIGLSAFILGIIFTVWAHLKLSSQHQIPLNILENAQKDIKLFQECNFKVNDEDQNLSPKSLHHHLPVVLGRTVDTLLQQLIDLILRDFLLVHLNNYIFDITEVSESFKTDAWSAVQHLHERLIAIDTDRLIASDFISKITLHLEKIRISQTVGEELQQSPVFVVSPHLESPETELNYLRKLCEFLITMFLPRSYLMPPIYYFLRETFACKVLQPAIDLVTEPDYINLKIIEYMEAQKEVTAMHVKTYEYAKTFEDYIKLINCCKDIETLKQIRYDIMSQIMQATTLENMKRARGIDIDEIDKGNIGTQTREQVDAAKRLKRYIDQLTFAKNECEISLKDLGWEGAFPLHDTDNSKTLSLQSVLESTVGRKHLAHFLESLCSQELVGCWSAVEELRNSHQSNWHQLGAQIYYTYVRSPSAEIKVDKDTKKRIEAFLLGDKGPDVFFEVQQQVFNTIQEKYYPSFTLSDHYASLVKNLANEESVKDISEERSPLDERQLSNESVSSCESVTGVTEHSTYARRKLQQLQEKHSNKTQALAALRASLKPDSKALKLLAAEVERLAGERRRVEVHLARTDVWARHLGSWRATLHSAELGDDSTPPRFVIVVHMAENDDITESSDTVATGWVIVRSLQEFQELHRKLRPLCNDLKSLELPSNTFKFLFGKSDKNALDRAKNQIQKYLDYVLENDRLNQSEALYAFLNPSSEHLKHSNSLPKKSRFSFSTLFKSNSEPAQAGDSFHETSDESEISLYLDGESGDGVVRNANANKGVLGVQLGLEDKDVIAEPLYALLGEIFDMRGLFKWLRRTLITFVQITYGRTINRQIRDTISWVFSENMLHYYITIVLKSWWPGGELTIVEEQPKPEEMERRKKQAEMLVLDNVPEILCSIVGGHTAKKGAYKLFHTLQLQKHNKQLLYEFIDLLILEVFPETKKHLHNKNHV